MDKIILYIWRKKTQFKTKCLLEVVVLNIPLLVINVSETGGMCLIDPEKHSHATWVVC